MSKLLIILNKTLHDKNREPFSHEVPVEKTFTKEECVLLGCKATL